ncbi:MAG: MoaD/ThiS family protein [Polyangiaceae bacterium]
MKIKILYFAELRDALGMSEEDWETRATSIGALASELATGHDAIRVRLPSLRFARNEAFASNDDAISEGDVVAVIPPVAGG